VVPVGLTRFRDGLRVIAPVSKKESLDLIDWLTRAQNQFLREKNTRFIWLSDEFYIIAEQEMPEAHTYESYPQWENGVGLVRSFLDDAFQVPLPVEINPRRRLVVAGGVAAMNALGPLWKRLKEIRGLTLMMISLENQFFGPGVNVSGLLTGRCLINGLSGQGLIKGETVYLSGVMIKGGSGVFLDDVSVDEVSEKLDLNLVFLPEGAKEALEVMLSERTQERV
jgi:putative radical SAM enzyme (TIGR03279 family)